ncbi:helix-turn-helix domain-containing protein [Niabella ginsengisoli]|uniref:helix-turn-helix domain-containing protein n=1 Tax=Niabella ginsengisoli TaxID=522298 RepID=UPI00293F265D|nr:AraC family transcriptional regulator [Niabella ginsengisoli]
MKEYFANSPLAHIKSMAHTKMDEEFLEKLNDCIIENIANDKLDVEHLALAMNMSRPTLYRKVKSISNLSPNEMINISRLKKAVELMNTKVIALSEIAERVGYHSLTQFGRNFQKQFKITPSEYQQQQK